MIKIENKTLIDNLTSYYTTSNIPIEEVTLFGILNEENKDKDVINDVIGLYYKQRDLYLMKATCNSGRFYIQNPMNTSGAAQLDYGYQSKIWKVGLHNGKYQALVNREDCGKVRVWRDKDKDYIHDESEKLQEGYYGTNLHHMGVSEKTEIGKNSAGCQVIHSYDDFLILMSMIKDSDMYKKIKAITYFSYNLFRKEEMIELYNEVYK